MGIHYTNDNFFLFSNSRLSISTTFPIEKVADKQHSLLIKSFFVKASIPKVVNFPQFLGDFEMFLTSTL